MSVPAMRLSPSDHGAGIFGKSAGVTFRGIALVCAFWLLTADYLFVYFSSDDLMNLFESVGKGWDQVRGLILFGSSDYVRPMGGVLYLGLYSLFGLHPLPFKLFMLFVLCVNLLLAWRIATLVLGDSGLGALAAVLVLYHASEKLDVWYNFGNFATIYDIVCFTFMYGAFWIWLEARRGGRFPGLKVVLGVAALQILALDSKEMALALPVLLFLWEVFFGHLLSRTGTRVQWRALPGIVLLSLITMVFLLGKSRGAGSLLNIAAYRPEFTAHIYFQNMSRYLNQIFYSAGLFHSGITGWFLGGGLVAAFLLRAPGMAFGWLWFMVAILPVVFVPGRSGSVLYIPALGLAVGTVALFRRIFQIVAGKMRHPLQRRLNPAGIPVFLLAFVCLIPVEWHFKRLADPAGKELALRYKNFAQDLTREGRASLARSVLYLRDPFDPERWDPEFLTSLLTGNHGLVVGRVNRNQALLSPAVMKSYGAVFDYDAGHFRRVTAADLPEVARRLRAASGYAEPVTGIDEKPGDYWLARKSFALAAHCPSGQASCRIAFELGAPVATFSSGAACAARIDLGGMHWQDIALPARSDSNRIEIPVSASAPGELIEFRLDCGRPPARPREDDEAVIPIWRIHVQSP